MTYDKQTKNFVTQQKQQSIVKKANKKNDIISHHNSTKKNKFNRTNIFTNGRLMMVDLSPLKAQTHHMIQPKNTANISCIKEQKENQKQQQQNNTIVGTVFKQEISKMAKTTVEKTHMTLKEYFEFSNPTTNAATTLATSKRINKNMCVQQKASSNDIQITKRHQHQIMMRPTYANTTDLINILSNKATASTLMPLPSPSSSLCTLLLTLPPPLSSSASSSAAPPSLPPLTIITQTLRATEFNVGAAAMARALTNPVTGDVVFVKNSQTNMQQCNNVCVSSKCSSSKQKFAKQLKTKCHCKSANISSSKNNFNNVRTFSKTNINNHHTDDNADGDADADAAVVAVATPTTRTTTEFEGTAQASNNINTTSTTNKANMRFNTISTTTNIIASATTTTTHTDDYLTFSVDAAAAAAVVATRPAEPTTNPATTAPTTTYGKVFPLRQRFYQNTKQLECLLRAIVFSFMFVMSMQYQTVSASTSMMSKHEPMFISRSETFKFVAGDTIVLPCEVANTDPYVVAWKRGIAILTAGSVKVTPDPRVRLVNGFNLQIRDAVPQDAGDYICQIATMEPREITHTVEILVPPRIHHISTSGHLQVKKGSSVRIECSASGNPTPNVTWSRKNNILPNGEEKLHSHILSIENVDRHKGGVYICTANNGVGQPASSQVVLHVLYPPEITVERPVVFSGEGHEAMLVCIVHGETQPEVIWFKDTMQLDTTERHIMENRGSRHTLIIRKVHPQDFGNYSCVAENQLGKSRKTLQLSGKPNVAVFNSPPISQYKDRYNISWTVESHTPIEEYKLSFRRLQQGQEVDNSIDSHSSSSSMLQMYGGSSVGNLGANAHNYRLGGLSSLNSMGGGSGVYGGYGSTGNGMHWGRNDWRDVVLPAIPTSHHYTQGMSYMIRGLDPDQHYEATVQARNRYGWSDYSQSYVFSTSSNDNEMRDLSVTFYGGKSPHVQTSYLLLLAVLATSLCVLY